MRAKCLALSMIGLLVFGASLCAARQSSEDWQKDLRDLQRQIVERHVDAFHSVPKEEFEAAVSSLEERIPNMETHEILVGFAQIVAMIGDGHTSMYAGNQGRGFLKRRQFDYYPIKLWAFDDGIYVIATTPENVSLFGKRLVQIDNTPIDEAFRRVSTAVSADNEMQHTYEVPFELVRAEMLIALGIVEDEDRANFLFEGGVRKTLDRISQKKWLGLDWRSANVIHGGKRPVSMRPESLFASALTMENLQQRRYYWFTYLEDKATVFFQYNNCWDQKNRPAFAEVAAEMFQLMDSRPVERLVIDLRQNSGGEPLIAEPLVRGLEARAEFGEEGRLFVLVGRRTFSAALTNAVHLRRFAGARIVGEPPRGKPNNPSEGRDIDLKRTKIWATVSTEFVERDGGLGDVDLLPVDIPVAFTFEQHRAAEDPFLAAALAADVKTGGPEMR